MRVEKTKEKEKKKSKKEKEKRKGKKEKHSPIVSNFSKNVFYVLYMMRLK